jgi:Zn-dependent protease with chaperone function
MQLIVALLLALVPGLLNYWWGRGLLRQGETADLPERLWRHRRRVMTAALWFLIVVGIVGGLVPVLVLVVTVLAGGFPARKRLYDESWRFPAYGLFYLRVFLAFSGFWIALAATPLLIVQASDGWMWPVAGGCALVLVLWSHYFSVLFPRILGASTLEGDALAPFAPYFAPVLERTTAPQPHLWWVPLKGGRFANAVALPSRRGQPGVLFWETLLSHFTPREVGAVFAHEVAHLEQFHQRLLRRMAALEWILITIAVGCVPLVVGPLSQEPEAPTLRWLVPLVWSLVVMAGLVLRLQISRRYETDADRRALELCQDPDALVAALEKLHALSRMPRRMALREEKRISHPTLARRIAAIRRASQPEADPHADSDADPHAGSAPKTDAGEAAPPLTILHPGDHRRVVLEPHRVSWLEGVPEGTEESPQALLAAASRITTLAYDQLAELRLKLQRGRHTLRAADTVGSSWEVPVPPTEVAAVQGALDTVDQHLVPPTVAEASPQDMLLRVITQLAALAGGIAAVLVPLPSVLAAGLLAALWPRAALLGAFAATALGAGVLLLAQGQLADPDLPLPIFALVLTGLLAVAGARLRWRNPSERPWGALAGGVLFGGGALLLAAGGAAWLLAGDNLDPFHIHQTALSLPGLGLLALGAAVAWRCASHSRWPRVRWLAWPFGLLGIVALFTATPLFEQALVRDALLVPRSVPTPTVEAWQETASVDLGTQWPQRVRVSPSGERFALLSGAEEGAEEDYGEEDYEDTLPRWILGDFATGLGTEAIEAEDLYFLDEETLLVLTEAPADDTDDAESVAWHLRQVARTDLGGTLWQIELPGLSNPQLGVAPGTGTWWVAGLPGWQEDEQESGYRRYQGRAGSGAGGGEAFQTQRWASPSEDGFYDLGYWTASPDDWALSWTLVGSEDEAPLAAWTYWLREPQWELWSVAAATGTAVRRLTTQMDFDCTADPVGNTALCLAPQGKTVHLWRVALDPARPLEPLARLDAGTYGEVQWIHDGALIQGGNKRLWRLDVGGNISEIRLPGEPHLFSGVLAEEGALVTGVATGAGYRLLRFAH